MTHYTHDAVATRWVAVCEGRETRLRKNHNMVTYGEGLFSFGSHFELARPLRNDKGRLTGFLLNGDTYSNTTTRHQNAVRGAVAGAKVPHLIVPYSALDAAGIDKAHIQIVEALPDRWIESQATVRERRTGWYYDAEQGTWMQPGWAVWSSGVPREVATNDDGSYTFWSATHRLGESLFTARVNYEELVTCECEVGQHPERFPSLADRPTHCPLGNGCERYRHRNVHGRYEPRASGQRTVRGVRTAQFLSGWDHNESRPLYFLSEMPHRKSRTVEQAYEALKPKTVQHAEACGREVLRQGDIFAVPLLNLDKRALRKMGARFERMGQLLTTNHVATEVATLPDGRTLARGVLWHRPRGREADHKRVKLTPGRWHLTVKNTVPLAG